MNKKGWLRAFEYLDVNNNVLITFINKYGGLRISR